ncbi:hypothetical protein ACS0TY_000467 [Phlomoides rotata]
MKILSLNTRGTNSKRKRKRIKELVRDTKTDFLCVQETKKEVVTKDFCESLWIDKEFGWSYSGSCGAAGGMIIIWKKSTFKLEQQWSIPGALAIRGKWGEEGEVTINVINVYAPRKAEEQQVLWNELIRWVGDRGEEAWCICGDFNAIAHQSERKGTGWCNSWKEMQQISLKRSISDHAPIMLVMGQEDQRGPMPFRMVNWWLEHPNFKKLVMKVWLETDLEGWAGYICKEKMKKLKGEIKRWKQVNGTGFSKEIEETKKALEGMDNKLDSTGWTDKDKDIRRDLLIRLEEFQMKRDRLLMQKGRAKWLKEGDENTSFYHSLINKRNKLGEIKCVKIQDRWREGNKEVT